MDSASHETLGKAFSLYKAKLAQLEQTFSFTDQWGERIGIALRHQEFGLANEALEKQKEYVRKRDAHKMEADLILNDIMNLMGIV